MKLIFHLLASCILVCVAAAADESASSKTLVEVSKPKPAARNLSTVNYAPTEKERPFKKKVTERPPNGWAGVEAPPAEGEKPDPKQAAAEKERREKEKAQAKAYTLAGQAGEYVGWCGIVRRSTWNEAAGRTELLVQHCYDDGLTDAHLQVVSIYGAGDFRAVLDGRAKDVPLLGLVRVYGKVSVAKDGTPEVAAEYVRVWHWGLFTFMDYGDDKTNPAWSALRRVKGEDVYDSRPTTKYYEAVLGKREPVEKKEAEKP